MPNASSTESKNKAAILIKVCVNLIDRFKGKLLWARSLRLSLMIVGLMMMGMIGRMRGDDRLSVCLFWEEFRWRKKNDTLGFAFLSFLGRYG
jgi:hypothetical protein